MAKQLDLEQMVGAFVAIIVGVALISPLQTNITNANITDPATASIVALVLLAFGVGLLVNTFRTMI